MLAAAPIALLNSRDIVLGKQCAPVLREPVGKPRIKTSICAYSLRKSLTSKKETLDDFLNFAAKLGFEGVELTFYYFPNYPAMCSDKYIYDIKRKAFLLGLDISGTAVGNNFCKPDAADRAKEIARVKLWTEAASKLGAPAMRVFGGSIPKGYTEDDCVKWTSEAFKECCEHAGKYGVMLAMENHGGFPETAEQALKVYKAVNSKWLGLNLDTGNFKSADPYREIEMLAPYAITCHIKTAVTLEGKRVPVDMHRVVKILRNAGYSGYLPIEYSAKDEPKTGITKFLKKINAALK